MATKFVNPALEAKAAKPKTYRLTSTPMFHTPGVLAWAINGYKFKKDRKQLLNVFVTGYPGPSAQVYDRLLKGEIKYTVEGDAVIFTA